MDKELIRRLGLPEDEKIKYVEHTDDVGITSGDIIMLGVIQEAVLRGHVESYVREFQKFGKKKLQGRIWMSFQGWESDPREVYEIQEIRRWVERLIKNVPHLFYFLSREDVSMLIIFRCLLGTGEIRIEQAQRLIEKVTKSAVLFSKKSGDSESVQFALANNIMKKLGYDQ